MKYSFCQPVGSLMTNMVSVFRKTDTKKMHLDKKVLLYSTGNYIQYPVINHNGKEYKKEFYIYIYTHTYTYRNQFAVQQKLTQHGKSTILQKKKKRKMHFRG